MGLLNDGDNILVTLRGSFNNQAIINTFYYRVTVAPTTKLPQFDVFEDLLDLFNAPGNLIAKFVEIPPGQYTLDQVWMQVVFPGRYVAYKFNAGIQGAGEDVGRTPNLAGVITRRTDKAGRNQVGSLHIPVGQGDNSVDNGLITGTTLSAMNALALVLKNSYTVSGYTFRPVLTPFNNGDGSAKWIDSAFTQDTARVMRRRTLRLGI